MENNAMTIGAVLLAGGRGRRMGNVPKGLLQLSGQTFLRRIAGELDEFEERILSVGQGNPYPDIDFCVVEDERPDAGALGGLYSALRACRSDALLAVSCDMPLFHREVAAYLTGYLSSDWDAVIAMDRTGRRHPLCGVYRKTALPVMMERLQKEDYRMRHTLSRLRVKEAPLRHSVYPDDVLANINTPEELTALSHRQPADRPPVVAVSGVKNAGKTTLLEGLLPVLAQNGLRVAVIKHDGHDFAPDVPGTDSFRLRAAGACGVAVYSKRRFMLTDEWEEAVPGRLMEAFSEVDLILLEGGKYTQYPKIEVVRGAVSREPVCSPDTLLAIASDLALEIPGVPCISLKDYTALAARIRAIVGW